MVHALSSIGVHCNEYSAYSYTRCVQSMLRLLDRAQRCACCCCLQVYVPLCGARGSPTSTVAMHARAVVLRLLVS